MKSATVKIDEKHPLTSVQGLLGRLLEGGVVDMLLVPKLLPGGEGYVQTLIKDPVHLEGTNPFAPTMAVQSATVLSDLTSDTSETRIGAVLKPCELRATVELAKFLQISPDSVVAIGVDCAGTYPVRDLAEMAATEGTDDAWYVAKGVVDGDASTPEGYDVRENCRICEFPAPENAALSLGFWGVDPSQQLSVRVAPQLEKEVAEVWSLVFSNAVAEERTRAIETVVTRRRAQRRETFDRLKAGVQGPENLMKTLATCVRCHNCMRACPICYCKECVFDSAIFDHPSAKYENWALRRGVVRMPTDTLIFHLTRMSHMATSCIGCGMCESACPSQLPIASLFGLVGSELQQMFEYDPGRDPGDEPPITVFKEDELQKEAEQ